MPDEKEIPKPDTTYLMPVASCQMPDTISSSSSVALAMPQTVIINLLAPAARGRMGRGCSHTCLVFAVC